MTTIRTGFHRSAVAAAVVLALAGAAQAQLSSATIQGQITSGTAAAQAGLPVTAVNTANGNTYRTTTRADGSYVLPGLAPGVYEIRVDAAGGAQKSQRITVQVGETASVDLALGAAGQQVTIVGTLQRKDVRTSEVGTSVSRKQIEALPQVTRNFLSFADMAPGVRFDVDQGSGQTTLKSGAQNQDNVNVFIDGVGQKNYILRGGISGLDSTRGNAFPQSAIAEYKVISQNYKAEFDQVSSVAITAITKSGTNEFHGEAFIDRTGANWTAADPFEKKAEAAGVKRPSTSQKQYGFALGGPIKQDVLHFFVAYDGKDIEEPRQVIAQRADQLPNAGIVPGLLARQGSTKSTFQENLLLAKLDAQIADDQKLELSVRYRDESDRVPEDKLISLPGNELDRENTENRVTLKHEWTRGDVLSEARLGYEDYTWNPHSAANTPLVRYLASPTNNINNIGDVLLDGGSPNMQRRQQKGVFVSEDLTFTGLAGHTMKGGVKLKDLKFALSGTFRGVDSVRTIIDKVTGQPYYDPGNVSCLGTSQETINGRILKSDQCQIDPAVTPVGVSFKNQQIGLYFQDDWKLSKQLELNLGLRWDYETNALNDDYATPADRVAALRGLDGVRANITPAPGQTYAQSLAKGGIDIEQYISNGNSRKAFTGAWQPRVGFSYDLTGDRSSVIFAGAGRAYDRAMANHALDEMQKNAQPNGEIWLIKNDHKMPFTDQYTLGLRQAAGIWNTEVALSRSHAKNQFNWFGGNRDPNGGFGTQSSIDPLWGGPNGYGTLVLGDFVTQAKTDMLYLKADKPYTTDSGWAVSVAYTYSDAKTTHRSWTNDIFNWTYGKSTAGWNPSLDVDKHRLVATGLSDKLLPWGVLLSGKLTYAAGRIRQLTDCSAGFNNCVYRVGDKDDLTQFDLGVAKSFSLPLGKVSIRIDVLNLFNTVTYGGYDDWVGGPGNPKNYLGGDNANLGVPNSRGAPMRTYKLGLAYSW
ncbi:TonB-dependent receptor [Aquabacterium sp.]|uniref:TonB-dependent receptor n=1 Tax=Aquabacterium sp. TaxID=1872578 RepID=UPI002B8D5CF2|nr:TonB-dependent receptor [Aquabacterium sp.]HSW09225.1 TonB-dependent receptor [Aquabacterium sp.]